MLDGRRDWRRNYRRPGTGIHNLNLRGNSDFNPAKPETYTRGPADGVRVSGGQVSLRDVYVSHFSRHGMNVDSSWEGSRIYGILKMFGLRGIEEMVFISVDRMRMRDCAFFASRGSIEGWGFYDDAVIPSTFIAPLTDGNHNDPTRPKQTVEIAQINRR